MLHYPSEFPFNPCLSVNDAPPLLLFAPSLSWTRTHTPGEGIDCFSTFSLPHRPAQATNYHLLLSNLATNIRWGKTGAWREGKRWILGMDWDWVKDAYIRHDKDFTSAWNHVITLAQGEESRRRGWEELEEKCSRHCVLSYSGHKIIQIEKQRFHRMMNYCLTDSHSVPRHV